MHVFTRARILVAWAVFTCLLMGSGAFVAPPVEAATRRFRVVHYFNNAAHTQRVGIGRFLCNRRSTLQGGSTRFSTVVVNEPCCGNVPC